MKKVRKQILAVIILANLLINNFFPVVYAMNNTDDTFDNTIDQVENATKEVSNESSNVVQEDIINNDNNEEKITTNFDVLLAGVLNNHDIELEYSKVKEVINSNSLINQNNGIWISEQSREIFINLINSVSNENFKVNNNGFLQIDEENIKNQNEKKDEYTFYTEKILELMNSETCIIISIEENYKNLNNYDNAILDMIIEDDEYALLFKNDDNSSNISDIAILNQIKYSNESESETKEKLFNKFLEVFYFEDEAFNEFVQKQEFKVSNEIESNIENDIKSGEEINDETIADENITDDTIKDDIEKENIFDDRVTEEQFNIILSSIITNEFDASNVQETISNAIGANKGIWIAEDSRNSFIDFINMYTIYTYSVDSNGFLVCDKIMKENPNLDLLEKAETEIDIEIQNVINKNVFIAIGMKQSYKMNEDNQIVEKELKDDTYKVTFSNNNNRIILLNSNCFLSSQYDLGLSDYFVKSLDNVEEKVYSGELILGKRVLTRSDTSKPGNMYSAQNVYAGPDSSNYAKIGSVSSGELVYILGQSAGWYHIQYMVTGNSIQKSGFVPVNTVNNNGYSVHEEIMTGGQRYTNHGIAVQSCDDFNISTQIGSIFEGEGVTLLYSYGYSDASKSYNVAFVEFSTSTGTKRGYMYTDQLDVPNYPTSVARVVTTSSAYSGPDSSFVKLGGAYYNEYVSILAKEEDWVFVEYNTSAGRKRGFMSYSNLDNCNYPKGGYADFPIKQGIYKATQQLIVYGGPNSNFANIGTIFEHEVITVFSIENGFRYIEYSTSNGAKRGFVDNNYLLETQAPILPNIPTYNNFSSGVYGTSGLGTELKYYKLGNGPNVIFAVFAQHGWEDAWAFDGVELVNIADRMMSSLASKGLSNNWTLYVIPYANPDGITNGYTNNGPGRCTVTTKIDMNRSWPANFVPYVTSSRNYTGNDPLGTIEGVNLKKFLESHDSANGTTVLLDIHGWLDITYGDSDVGAYFNQQFGSAHNNSYGSGYLETWGKSNGYKSCLVELPKPVSPDYIISENYSGKVTNAIINLANNLQTEEGEVTNEKVQVYSTGNVNIRKFPTVSSEVVATVANETILIRVKKAVTVADGYTWDKVILQNGTQGYIATNFLTFFGGNIGYKYNTIDDDFKVVKAYLKYEELYYKSEIDNRFDNQLMDAIEEFQKHKGLVVSGDLNTETLVNMYFSVDDSGKLIRNKRYNAYMKIAEYYNTNQGSFKIDDKTYKFAQNLSRADSQYIDKKQTEDDNYDTMSPSEKKDRYSDLLETKESVKSLSEDFEMVFPLAAALLKNYYDNTGYTVWVELDSLFEIEAIKTNIYEKYLERAMKGMEYCTNEDLNFARFALEYEFDGVVNAELNDFNKTDWYLATHGFKMGNSVSGIINDDIISIDVQFSLRDYYDWDDESGDVVAWPGVSDKYIEEKELRALHYAGMCRNFETRGGYFVRVEWKRGQSISEAKITKM